MTYKEGRRGRRRRKKKAKKKAPKKAKKKAPKKAKKKAPKKAKKKAKKKLSPAEKKAIKKAREKNNKEKEEEEKDKKEKEKLLNGVRQSGPKRRKQTGKFCKKNRPYSISTGELLIPSSVLNTSCKFTDCTNPNKMFRRRCPKNFMRRFNPNFKGMDYIGDKKQCLKTPYCKACDICHKKEKCGQKIKIYNEENEEEEDFDCCQCYQCKKYIRGGDDKKTKNIKLKKYCVPPCINKSYDQCDKFFKQGKYEN